MARVFEKLLQQDLNVGVGSATKTNPGGGVLTGSKIGVHSFAVGQLAVSESWNPGSVAAGGTVTKTVAVSGAALGDFVMQSFSLSLQGMQLTADVSAANTVTAVLSNLTGVAIDPGSGALRVLVFKSA